jgi:hypothetical protein
MNRHGRKHERLLEALVKGDRRPEEPEPTELLAGCRACRVALEELHAVSGLLDEAAREEQATLAGLEEAGEPPGSELVAPFFQARMAEARSRPEGAAAADAPAAPRGRLLRFPRRRLVAAAAAAVLGLGWLARLWIAPDGERSGQGRGTPPETLMGGARDLVGDLKAEPGYARFSWSYNVTGGESFRITFWDADAPQGTDSFHEVSDCLDESWSPTDDDLDTKSWPDRVRWRVEVVDPSGKAAGTPEERISTRG